MERLIETTLDRVTGNPREEAAFLELERLLLRDTDGKSKEEEEDVAMVRMIKSINNRRSNGVGRQGGEAAVSAFRSDKGLGANQGGESFPTSFF